MAGNKKKRGCSVSKRERGNAGPRNAEEQPAAAAGISAGAYVVGIALLAICVGTSGMLALDHLGGLSLPGCGEGSPCAEAAASVWGTVPGVNWPVSFLGLAYFLGMLVAWLTGRDGGVGGLRWLVRLGALASVGFVVVLFVEGHLCTYCLATHAGNLLFWVLMERVTGGTRGVFRLLATVAAVFLVCSIVLGMGEWRERNRVEAKAEEKLSGSVEKLIKASGNSPASQAAAAAAVTGAEPVDAGGASPDGATSTSSGGFSGRYLMGPEQAAIRVVVFSDYQCKECRRIEGDVIRLVKQRDDMSLSIKHYPMCADCNRRVKRTMHPNSCWAARAAEAAGILHGNDAFWQMHVWLFERGGSFQRKQLREALREFGYDISEFEQTMMADETLDRVKADVEEGIGLGIWFTPTIYINGVELRGWEASNAIPRAVAALAATSPEPMTAANDQPPPAIEKLIGDWAEGRRLRIPPAPDFRRSGPARAAVRIVMFGDYQHPGTAELDAVIRDETARRDEVRYEYHHFPFNKDCNPVVKKATKYPNACRAAAAGEAAGMLGGADAYWRMHAWLFEHQQDFDDAALRSAAGGLGLDADTLLAKMEEPEIQQAILRDATVGRRLGARSVPTVFINGRKVPRWKLDDRNILPQIIDQAAKE